MVDIQCARTCEEKKEKERKKERKKERRSNTAVKHNDLPIRAGHNKRPQWMYQYHTRNTTNYSQKNLLVLL